LKSHLERFDFHMIIVGTSRKDLRHAGATKQHGNLLTNYPYA